MCGGSKWEDDCAHPGLWVLGSGVQQSNWNVLLVLAAYITEVQMLSDCVSSIQVVAYWRVIQVPDYKGYDVCTVFVDQIIIVGLPNIP